MRKTLQALLVLGFLVLSAGPSAAECLDRIVAMVNGDLILYSELQEQIKDLQKKNPSLKTDTPENKAATEQEILHKMILDKLTDTELKRLKIIVGKQDVDDVMESIKKQNHISSDEQFNEMLKKEDLTLEKFSELIKKEMEHSRLLDREFKSKTIISDAQVDAYLGIRSTSSGSEKSSKKPSVATKEQRRLSVIFVSAKGNLGKAGAESRAKEALERLKDGGDFATIARTYSEGPAVDDGGDIGFMREDELSSEMASAVKKLGKGKISGLVSTGEGFYIIKVTDVKTEKVVDAVSSAASVPEGSSERETARKQLMQKELARKFEEWVKEIESHAYIKISL